VTSARLAVLAGPVVTAVVGLLVVVAGLTVPAYGEPAVLGVAVAVWLAPALRVPIARRIAVASRVAAILRVAVIVLAVPRGLAVPLVLRGVPGMRADLREAAVSVRARVFIVLAVTRRIVVPRSHVA